MEKKALTPAKKKVGTWVQTERSAHEALAHLIGMNPTAAQLLHLLIAKMGPDGALVISQATLAAMAGVSVSTIKRAIKVLEEQRWMQVMQLGSERGGVKAYVVNANVAWADKREKLWTANFKASVVLSTIDTAELKNVPLRQIPKGGEIQIPFGEGEPPPAQPLLDGTEPDLPATNEEN